MYVRSVTRRREKRRINPRYSFWTKVSLLLAAQFCAFLCLPVSAAEPPILSGCEIDYPPFCIVHEDGRADGFSVELMRAALQKMGREVTFRTGPWAEVRGWLERGEVDALPLVVRTPEREALFDFTFPYMSLYGAIVVRNDAANIHDLDGLRGRQVAVMKGDNTEEFLRREARGIEIHTTPTFEDALRQLSEGKHDAVVIQRLVALRLIAEGGWRNLRVIDKPIKGVKQDFCFAVKEGDRDTLALLNEGLAIVMADGTYRHLHAKWFAALQLPSDRPIVVGGDHNYPPFEYLNERGIPTGYCVELTRAIAAEMGFEVEIRLGSWADMLQAVETGDIDVVQGMFYLPERDLKFDFTQPHTVSHYVSVVRKGEDDPPATVEELAEKRIVVQRGDAIHDFLTAKGLGDSRLSFAETQEDVLRELSEGKHDCALAVRVSSLYLIEKNGWTNLELGRRPFVSMDYCYSTLNNRKALLAQFSEGLNVLEKNGEYRRIHDKWLGIYQEEPLSLMMVLRYFAWVFLPLILILVAVSLWSWSLRRKVAARTRELRESLRRFRAVFETANVGKSITLPTGELSVNKAFADMLGYAPDELQGKTWQELTPPEDIPEIIEERIAPLLDGREGSTRFEKRYVRKDGGTVWADVSVALLRDAQGRPSHFITTAADISKRKRAEKKLARQLRFEQAVAAVSTRLLSVETSESVVPDALTLLLEASGVSRVYLFENFNDPDDGLCTRQTFEVCAPDVPSQVDNPLLQHAVYSQGFERWHEVLSAGDAVRGHVRDFPDNEAQVLEPQGIISILVLPLVVEGRWWGFIGFDETRRPRDWQDSEVALLRTAAEMLGSYFTRKQSVEYLSLLGRMLDDAPASITIHDTDGRFVFANAATVSLHGYENVDEFLKINLHELDVPESEMLLAERFRKIAENGEARFEVAHYRKDGSTFPLEVLAKRIEWERRPAVLSIATDITERKRAESHIEHLNRVLRAIRDVNQLITHETDRAALLRQSCEILVSTRGYRSAWVALRNAEGAVDAVAECGIGEDFGVVREALKGGDWPECCKQALEHPDGIAPMHNTSVNCKACALKHTYRDTAALAGSLRHARRDYGVLVVALPEGLADDDEEQSLFQELVGDVAYALHTMETAQLRRRDEARFRAYVEHAPYGIFITDRSGRYLDVNPAAGKITGYSEDDLLTMSIADLLTPESREMGLASFQKLIDEGRISEEMPFVHKSGEVRHWTVSAVALSEERFLGFAQDITERKKAEAEREELQSQLTQAQKMESVGRLAGGVAHDFNNILQAMMGYSAMLVEQLPEGDETREFAEEIATGVKRASTLTRQLLAFARKQTISPKVLDLNETVESMLRMLRRLIGEDIDLAWLPSAALWPVKMDPGQVDQILANLCVNARDAIGGVGRVTIETGKAVLDEAYCAEHAGFVAGQYTMLAVSDDGCGMDQETRDRVFEPFFTTKGLHEGTGLGLATVYGIVKQNEGFINVYSEPGSGTTFRIYLPRHASGPEEKPRTGKITVHAAHGETVLLVEDEDSILHLGKRMLESLGYKVIAAAGPREALKLVEERSDHIDLLITDVVMPEMSGRDLAQQLQSQCPYIKTLFMSGYTANVIAHRGVLEEGVRFIQKPFTKEDLAVKVREALDKPREA